MNTDITGVRFSDNARSRIGEVNKVKERVKHFTNTIMDNAIGASSNS
jgi:hypothetical protein